MKKLIFILLIIFASSCENTPTTPENPEKETTLEVLNAASDSCYNYAEVDDVLYIINSDGVVVKKVRNDSGRIDTMMIIAWCLWIFGFFIGIATKP